MSQPFGFGLVSGPTTPWWISDNGTGHSTLYNVHTGTIPFTVTVPGAGGEQGTPTGVVFNSGPGFVVTSGTGTARPLVTSAPSAGGRADVQTGLRSSLHLFELPALHPWGLPEFRPRKLLLALVDGARVSFVGTEHSAADAHLIDTPGAHEERLRESGAVAGPGHLAQPVGGALTAKADTARGTASECGRVKHRPALRM